MSIHNDSVFLSVFYCGIDIAIQCVSNVQCPSPPFSIPVKKKCTHLFLLQVGNVCLQYLTKFL